MKFGKEQEQWGQQEMLPQGFAPLNFSTATATEGVQVLLALPFPALTWEPGREEAKGALSQTPTTAAPPEIRAGISQLAPGDEAAAALPAGHRLLWDILKVTPRLCHMMFIHFHAVKWLENAFLGWEPGPEEESWPVGSSTGHGASGTVGRAGTEPEAGWSSLILPQKSGAGVGSIPSLLFCHVPALS